MIVAVHADSFYALPAAAQQAKPIVLQILRIGRYEISATVCVIRASAEVERTGSMSASANSTVCEAPAAGRQAS
jgi:hypothetical protein